MVGVGGGLNSRERDRLVKANILYIDGRDLHRSRMLDYTHFGRNVDEKAHENRNDQSSACNNNNSVLSRYVLEILVFLCSSDSCFYAKKFGVPTQDYPQTPQDYNVRHLCIFRHPLTEVKCTNCPKFAQCLFFCCRSWASLGHHSHHHIQLSRLFGMW